VKLAMWTLLLRCTPLAWQKLIAHDDDGSLRYRWAFWVMRNAWGAGDDAIGREYFPHWWAAEERVRRGQSIGRLA